MKAPNFLSWSNCIDFKGILEDFENIMMICADFDSEKNMKLLVLQNRTKFLS